MELEASLRERALGRQTANRQPALALRATSLGTVAEGRHKAGESDTLTPSTGVKKRSPS